MAALTLTKCRKILRSAESKGKELDLKPLSIVILDAGGNVVAFERADGASPGRFDIARGKAYGAVMLGLGGQAQMARAEAQAYFINAANAAFGGKLVPVPGGVLIRDGRGQVIGAVGITGDSSENDEICAIAGIEAAGYTPEP
ncbi:heme-binding protein [Actibacterium sp. 188UL27-1]|uniref:GlcG/HbpS family heme-binding protein n=1 Tax=Actibacterium sp. 188UL27-1 TaxID=2786961 RepID=UPI0019585C93|nr:heme-binding protein [Actibacterium sp. 188UL27-1]MBM7068006.1 heme-binding protein [Actibacterium sp. 188UL27-1]